MSIIVYWACNENEWLRSKEPDPVYKNFLKNIKDKNTNIELCPSIKDYMKNTFSIKSIYDYNFEISENNQNVFSSLYDQKFFDKHVIVRSRTDKLFSFSQDMIFFTEEKTLNMSAGIFPFLENNNITRNCITVPGTFDIGKWFRLTDFAFYLKNNINKFEIEENETYQYIKFNTNDKIIFKQFKINEKLNKYLLDITNAKEFRKIKIRSLENYYSMLKHKKYIIKEIKNNLVENIKK
jgi:hypothetical protein